MESEMGITKLAWLFGALFLTLMYCLKRSRNSISSVKFPMLCNEVEKEKYLLDLPDLALDCILKKLSPPNLSRMSRACTSLRGLCTSDHLWERHMKRKWGGLIGNLAYNEWKWSIASRKQHLAVECSKNNGLVAFLWSCTRSDSRERLSSTLPVDSIMALYLSLETGKFWFPAQVFNRENGHFGFLLSCYDAELSYNRLWGNFKARFSSEGRPTMEPDIDWTRLRAPAVETGPHALYPSDCLDYLKPGDHIEIQWKRKKEIPYGWWYGIVGHLEPRERCEIYCQCHRSDKVVLEFNQYDPGSRWRETIIRRSNHHEIGDGVHGFFGGIRKIYNKYEISMWQQHWPPEAM